MIVVERCTHRDTAGEGGRESCKRHPLSGPQARVTSPSPPRLAIGGFLPLLVNGNILAGLPLVDLYRHANLSASGKIRFCFESKIGLPT